MKKKIAFICFIVVTISLCIAAYTYFNFVNMGRYIFYCQLEEISDKYIFKATPTTFDTSTYGTSIYIEANKDVMDQIDKVCENKSIDLSEEMCLTFDCRKMKDINKMENTTCFIISKLINIEQG